MKPQLLITHNRSTSRQTSLALATLILLLTSMTAFGQHGSISPDRSGPLPGRTMTLNTEAHLTPPQSASSGLEIRGGTTQSSILSVASRPSLTMLNLDCGHVIQLLMANRIRQNTFQNGTELAPGLMLGSPWQQNPGDLELLGVHWDGTADSRNGPVFEVTLRNNSQQTLEHVTLSAVAVLGQIHEHSPTSVLSISVIDAAETIRVRIPLPASSMVMGPVGSAVQPFETLVVAVDSFDELIESNELNNVSILRRSEIPMIPVTMVASPAVAENPGSVVPTQSSSVPVIAAPEEAKPVSPLDAIDPDKLGEEMPMAN